MRSLLEAASAGTQYLASALQALDACLPNPVDRAFLFALIDALPAVCRSAATPDVVGLFLRQGLLWAGSRAPSDWMDLFNRYQEVCARLPLPTQRELHAQLLHLLGVDRLPAETRIRLTMSGPGLLSAHPHTVSGQTDQPPAAVFPFMALPIELRRLILNYVIPDSTAADYAEAVRHHGLAMLSVCKAFQQEAGTRLRAFGESRCGYWKHLDRLQASPQKAIEAFMVSVDSMLEVWPTKEWASVPTHEQLRAMRAWDEVEQELEEMAVMICLMPQAGQVHAAMSMLWAATGHCAKARGMRLAQAHAFGLGLCMVNEGQALLDALTHLMALLTGNGTQSDQEGFCKDLWAYALAHAPACFPLLSEPAQGVAVDLHEFQAYLHALPDLTDGQRFHWLRKLERHCSNLGSLSWLTLVAETHRASASSDRMLTQSQDWWALASVVVGAFLLRLHRIWPQHLPLPMPTLSRRVPADLLRRAFHDLSPSTREALLQRPMVFDEQGHCLQLTWLCDFCLDAGLCPDRRMDCLTRWTRVHPGLVPLLEAVALDWSLPRLPTPPALGSTQQDGDDLFQQDLDDTVARLQTFATRDEESMRRNATLAAKGFLTRAVGPRGFVQRLMGVMAHLVPAPVDRDFLFWAIDRTPAACLGEPGLVQSALRQLIRAFAVLPQSDALEALDRFFMACELHPPKTRLALWSALFRELSQPDLPPRSTWSATFEGKLADAAIRGMDQCFQACLALPAPQALAQWEAMIGSLLHLEKLPAAVLRHLHVVRSAGFN